MLRGEIMAFARIVAEVEEQVLTAVDEHRTIMPNHFACCARVRGRRSCGVAIQRFANEHFTPKAPVPYWTLGFRPPAYTDIEQPLVAVTRTNQPRERAVDSGRRADRS